MTASTRTPPTTRRGTPPARTKRCRPGQATGLAVAVAVVAATLWLVASVATGDHRTEGTPPSVAPPGPAGCPPASGPCPGEGPLGPLDGQLPDGRASVGDTQLPALANLDPSLLAAVQSAAADAAAGGVPMHLTSGWRSTRYQQALLDEAVRTRGADEADRWVAGPTESRHVTGDAVDIGPTDAADWLIRRGAAYGLCQTYANEMWHFELTIAPGGTCPPPVADAAAR